VSLAKYEKISPPVPKESDPTEWDFSADGGFGRPFLNRSDMQRRIRRTIVINQRGGTARVGAFVARKYDVVKAERPSG